MGRCRRRYPPPRRCHLKPDTATLEVLAREPSARLATVTPDGAPHLIPIVFIILGDQLVTPIDHKPKTGRTLQRVRNIMSEPRVSVLIDHYEVDWNCLWWYRLDGLAKTTDQLTSAEISALVRKYPIYHDHPLTRGGIRVQIGSISHWSATGS